MAAHNRSETIFGILALGREYMFTQRNVRCTYVHICTVRVKEIESRKLC